MPFDIVLSPEAETDLTDIYDYVAARASEERALAYTERLLRCCQSLADFPQRGTRRDEIRPGLRIIGFERRTTIAFHVTDDNVVIDRLLHGGRTLGK